MAQPLPSEAGPEGIPMVSRDLSAILDSVLAGIVVLDAAGSVELVNAAGARILEQSPETTQGRTVERLLGAEHALARTARNVLATERSAAENGVPVERRFAPDLVVDLSAAPLFDDSGAMNGAVLFLRDATLQRDLQRMQTEREHLEAFGQIAAGVAHEVKNPLGGIRGAAELLGARAADAKTADTAGLIVREVDRIASLLDDLMEFTHGRALVLAPVNIHRVIDDVIELVRHDEGSAAIGYQLDFDPSIPEVLIDEDRLKQVFLNLARNAIQAMGSGGRLTVVTRTRLDRRIMASDENAYPTLRIEFLDEGPGFSPEHFDQLATPFFTTRVDGTGLGLAVSRQWVAQHHGVLRFSNRSEGGACVRIDLPMRTEDRESRS